MNNEDGFSQADLEEAWYEYTMSDFSEIVDTEGLEVVLNKLINYLDNPREEYALARVLDFMKNNPDIILGRKYA